MKKVIWDNFCKEHQVKELGVELFKAKDRYVTVEEYDKNKRLILKRSRDMENLVTNEVNKGIDGLNNKTNIFDGLI